MEGRENGAFGIVMADETDDIIVNLFLALVLFDDLLLGIWSRSLV